MREDSDTRELLKSRGLKVTPQRVAVYNSMRFLGHASADDVFRNISEDVADGMNVATVYNVLQSLTDAGLLVKRLSADRKMYFDVTTANHCHFYDEETNSISDYDDPELVAMVENYLKGRKLRNFELDRVDIQLLGKTKGR